MLASRSKTRAMTTLISTLALHLESHDGFLFTELAFTLRQGDRIGLIGHNGCGKSTLLGLLSGKREATSGSIHTARACRLQHVEQHLPAGLASLSLYDALLAPVLDSPELHWRSTACWPNWASMPLRRKCPCARCPAASTRACCWGAPCCKSRTCCCSMNRAITWTCHLCCGWSNSWRGGAAPSFSSRTTSACSTM